MYVQITDPTTGEIFEQRELQDHEVMDMDVFARNYAGSLDMGIDSRDGYVPDDSGDFRAVFLEDPSNPIRIWDAQSFYFEVE